MSISLNDVVDQVRRSFRDVKWQDATLKEWVRDAVRDYAAHFPLVEELNASATTGTYEYSFGATCIGVLEVEYPTGDDPPTYPNHRDHKLCGFHDGGNYYDVVVFPAQDDAELWLSDPTTGESYNVKYLTGYTWTADGSDYTCAVPDNHRVLIAQYVIWCCWREMMTIEKDKGDLESRYNVLAERVLREREYYDGLIRAFKAARPKESEIVTWSMDEFDPIY